MRRTVAIAAGMALSTMTVAAQLPGALRFEVASIKRIEGNRIPSNGRDSPDRYYWADVTLQTLIAHAWDMPRFQIVGGPDWMTSATWEVSARAERAVSSQEMKLLARRLFEERFALKTHVETRELPIYELVTARDDRRLGPNMKAAEFDCEPVLLGRLPAREAPPDAETGFPRCGSIYGLRNGSIEMRLNGRTMARVASALQTEVQRRVIDRTGLAGTFDISLTYEDDRSKTLFPDAPKEEAAALFTALREQLGLRLQSGRGPVEVLVIDHAALPTPD